MKLFVFSKLAASITGPKAATRYVIHLSLVAVLLSAFLTLPMIFVGCASDATEVRIGAVFPLSGDGASYGRSMQRGIELYLASEGDALNGGRRVRVIYEDSQLQSRQAVTAFNKLIDADRVPMVLGPFSSSEMLAMAPIAERRQVVVLSATATAPEIPESGDYLFRIIQSDDYDGRVVARIIQRFVDNPQRVGIVYINNDYGTGIRNAFLGEAQRLGLTVAAQQAFAPETTDFRTQIQRLRSDNVDTVFLVGYKEMGRFLRQAHEAGADFSVVSTGLMEDPEIVELAGEGAEGVLYSHPTFNPESQRAPVRSFADRYRERYGEAPDIIAALGYDLMFVTAAALNGVENATGPGLRQALLDIRHFPGVAGDITFDDDGDVVKPIGVKAIRNGNFVWVEESLSTDDAL